MPKLLAVMTLATLIAGISVQAIFAQTNHKSGANTMAEAPITRSIAVPGASIYVEKRGKGPTLLLLPGGAEDVSIFAALTRVLADRFTVIALDPRCNSRSPCDARDNDLDVDQHADDAAAVIEAFGSEPVLVFGTSGGAQVGLNLASRHPNLVRALVAHEPPSMMVMDDPAPHLAASQALQDTYRSNGVEAAITQFMAVNGLDASEGPPPDMSVEDMETFGRMNRNFEYWLAHGMLPLSQYRPDIEKLKAGSPKIIVALGKASVGQPIHEMGTALAMALGVQPATFPGDHMGFVMDPVGFAKALQAALNAG